MVSEIWINSGSNFIKQVPIWTVFSIYAICLLGAFSAHAQSREYSSSTQTDQRQLMTKQQALVYLAQQMTDGADPMKRELIECTIINSLNETYRGKTTLEKSVIESGLIKYLEELNKNESKATLMAIKCIANSKEVEKAVAENSKGNLTKPFMASYPLTDIDDLRVDMASIDGKRISVRGIGVYFMESFLLKKSKTDMNPIFIDTTKLAREHRREIISQCGNATSTCRVTIYGAIGTVSYQKGIIAEQIEWQSNN